MNDEIRDEIQRMPRLVRWLVKKAMRTPYFHLDGYMQRWWLVKERWITWRGRSFQLPAVRVHRILRGDDDRHHHDHPRNSISVILEGSYTERFPESQRQHPRWDQIRYVLKPRRRWSLVLRWANTRHIISPGQMPAWSLFITWGRKQEWGFYTENGWVHWKEYVGREDELKCRGSRNACQWYGCPALRRRLSAAPLQYHCKLRKGL